MLKYIPNILTTLRIVLVPVFVWFFFFPVLSNHLLWAAVIFIIAEITDYLDGMIARKYNIISNYGKVMDPLADKLLTGAALVGITVTPYNLASVYAVIVILFREIAVSLLRQVYVKRKIYMPANNWGKLKTVTQMVGLSIALVYLAITPQESVLISLIFYYYFWFVALVTAFSGVSYFLPLFLSGSREEQ
jgi:CDP-diacylglycerol---glycerol-3-phosphate 3-phosphatidyltransferase